MWSIPLRWRQINMQVLIYFVAFFRVRGDKRLSCLCCLRHHLHDSGKPQMIGWFDFRKWVHVRMKEYFENFCIRGKKRAHIIWELQIICHIPSLSICLYTEIDKTQTRQLFKYCQPVFQLNAHIVHSIKQYLFDLDTIENKKLSTRPVNEA